jgi:LuxR family maltose regulon positive regulatory protein
VPLLDALRVTSLTLTGHIDRALRVAERSPANFSDAGLGNGEGVAWREVESLANAWVRLMMGHGRFSDALRTADMALSYARAKGIARMALRLNVLVARCADAMGERARAGACIEEICGEVARTGYLRAVLREGPDLVPLLRAFGPGLASETLRRQAQDIDELLSGQAEAALRTPVFSPRELDVLLHLNQGLQDKIIARRLGVSEHAVRFHLKNIYAKTRARGRLEAVVRARELGVLGRVPS